MIRKPAPMPTWSRAQTLRELEMAGSIPSSVRNFPAETDQTVLARQTQCGCALPCAPPMPDRSHAHRLPASRLSSTVRRCTAGRVSVGDSTRVCGCALALRVAMALANWPSWRPSEARAPHPFACPRTREQHSLLWKGRATGARRPALPHSAADGQQPDHEGPCEKPARPA